MSETQKPTVSRVVQVPSTAPGSTTLWRPAIVTAVWSEDCINVTVFLDGSNDFARTVAGQPLQHLEQAIGLAHRTSLSALSGMWRWPPRE
jgi:hypothetical protein